MISKNNHNLFYIKIIRDFILKISFYYKVSYFYAKFWRMCNDLA